MVFFEVGVVAAACNCRFAAAVAANNARRSLTAEGTIGP
jgi:hypothetical protein